MLLNEQVVLRFICAEKATPDDFKSYAALGNTKVGVDPCRLSSCSFRVRDTPIHVLAGMRKLPGLKHCTHLAHVLVDENSGKAKISSYGHIDLWLYASFDPLKAIQKIEVAP